MKFYPSQKGDGMVGKVSGILKEGGHKGRILKGGSCNVPFLKLQGFFCRISIIIVLIERYFNSSQKGRVEQPLRPYLPNKSVSFPVD